MRLHHRNTIQQKWCYKCLQYKLRIEFSPDKSRGDGLRSMCKICQPIADKLRIRPKQHRDYSNEWERDLQRNYSLSMQDYDKLFDAQCGYCKICGTHQSKLSKRLAVDHNHETGQVRGLLCTSCNLGLGNFKENTRFLEQAGRYLLSLSL